MNGGELKREGGWSAGGEDVGGNHAESKQVQRGGGQVGKNASNIRKGIQVGGNAGDGPLLQKWTFRDRQSAAKISK